MKKLISQPTTMIVSPEAKELMAKLKKWYAKLLKAKACHPYKNCSGGSLPQTAINPFVTCWNTYGKTDSDKAFILLVGKEKWYRGCHCWTLQMKVSLRNTVLKAIETAKPWAKTFTARNFEDLYHYAESLMPMPGISQLYIYDTALRLAMLDGRKQLMPDKKVYVHAKPMLGMKKLIQKGVFCGLAKPKENNAVIDRKTLVPWLGKLTAVQIEDILCYIGKSCNRIKNGKTSANGLAGELDDLLLSSPFFP